jgi:hypothetical protein
VRNAVYAGSELLYRADFAVFQADLGAFVRIE